LPNQPEKTVKLPELFSPVTQRPHDFKAKLDSKEKKYGWQKPLRAPAYPVFKCIRPTGWQNKKAGLYKPA